MPMRLKIIETIEMINSKLDERIENNDFSLLIGNSGVILYKAYYNKVFKKNHYNLNENLSDLFNHLSKNINSTTFCNGISGICWTYKHLINNNFIDADINALDELDDLIGEKMIADMRHENYDFLHGALGSLWYFLESNINRKYDFIIAECIKSLKKISKHTDNNSVYWDFTDHTGKNNISNFSLSHGMSGILIILAECYKQNIEQTICKDLIYKGINQIKKYKRKTPISNTLYPNSNAEYSLDKQSRLAWCYGDLGIATMFRRVGEVFNDESLIRDSNEIILENAKRKNLDEAHVMDALICHGSSGIAMIFKTFYEKTNISTLKDAYMFWLEQTIAFNNQKNLSGFKAYRYERGATLETGLLEGIAGIGLFLLNELSEDKNEWTKALLLI